MERMTVTLAEPGEDAELKAMSYIASVLESFPDKARERILRYLMERLVGAPT